VLDEIAPEGWERSPLLACFHPSIERIFEERLLIALGADWVYHFPALGIVELPSRDDDRVSSAPGYSLSESAIADVNAKRCRAEVQSVCAEIEEANARAREEAMDREPPASFARIVGCMVATLAAGRQRDRDGGTRRLRDEIAPMHTCPDVSADRVLNADAPKRNCPGAMARVKAALAALGASRP
jgi:hypothetical protein